MQLKRSLSVNSDLCGRFRQIQKYSFFSSSRGVIKSSHCFIFSLFLIIRFDEKVENLFPKKLNLSLDNSTNNCCPFIGFQSFSYSRLQIRIQIIASIQPNTIGLSKNSKEAYMDESILHSTNPNIAIIDVIADTM